MANLGLESNATPIKTGNSISSKYEQTVCLEDWWLVKSKTEIDGKKLAIEGFALKKPQAMCVFSSAPIIKRYNICTLRTADGITILIRGSINASRTLENGFSSEMCGQFLLGFPYCWETYANPLVEDESTCRGGVTTSMDAFLESTTMLSSLPNFLRGRTNTRTHTHIFCFPDVAESSVSTENVRASLLEKCSGNDLRNPTMHVSADVICSSPVLGDSLPGKTPGYEERSVSEMKHGREKDLLCGIDGETVEKEKDVLWDEGSTLKGDRCMYPENKILTKKLFEENLDSSTVGLRVLLNGAVKSSDIDVLATKETLVDKEDCGIHEGTMGSEDSVFPNRDNFNNDSCNEPVLPLNEVVKSFNTELFETKETLIDREAGTVKSVGCLLSDKQDNLSNTCIEDGENSTLFSTSKRITRNALKNLVNSGKASSEHHASNNWFEEKHASASPNEGRPTKKERLRRCADNVTRKEASKDILIPIVNDLNNYNPLEVSVVLPVISKGSSEGFGRSKNSSKGQKKTQANLKVSGSANNFDGCWNESLKDASISVDSYVRTVDPCDLIGDVPFLPLNAKGVTSLDIELPETKENSIDKEGGAEENDGSLLDDKHDNLNDTDNVPGRDSIKENTIKEKSETPELPETKENSIDKEGGAEENEGSLLYNKQDNFNDTGNVPEINSRKENSIEEKSETPDDDIPVVQLNKEVTKLSVLESLPTEETSAEKKDGENVNLLSPSRRITRNSLKNVVNYGKASNGHHVSKKSLEEKCASTSPNEGCPIKDFRPSRCTYSAIKNDLPKDILVPMAKDMNTAHSSGVDVALTVDLKNSSKEFGSSKTSSKGEMKTRANLKSSRPANPSCGFLSGKADSLKEASASICPDIKSLRPSEVNAAVPGNIPYSTLVSVRGFSKAKVGYRSSKGTTCHSVSGSQAVMLYNFVLDKLSHGFTADIAGILQESLSEAPLAGTPDILDIAGEYIDHTMEDSPRQVNLEPNVSCSTKLGMDTQSAATRTRSRVKKLEGKGRKNTMCREHLSRSDVTSPSICKIDAMEEITDSPKGRRTNSTVKISRNKSKVDKPTNRDRSGLDRPNDIFQETVPGKTMWKEVPLLRTAGINRKIKYSNTPEQHGLTLKRSRCGRLLIPPLEFWRNEQVIYDEDREITGIQEGTPVEHPRGSRSEPQKIKRKLLYS